MAIFKKDEEKKKNKEEKKNAKKAKKAEATLEKQIKKQEQKEAVNRINAFKPDVKVGNILFIDSEKRQFKLKGLANAMFVFDLDNINGYEVIENGSAVTSGGLGRAAVGALAFGGVGAIVGAVTGKKQSTSFVDSMEIKITMNDIENPVAYINLINTKVKRSSLIYKSSLKLADQAIATLDAILNERDIGFPNIHDQDEIKQEHDSQAVSPIDEVRKYKELLDEGILTQEEFDLKKKELLNL